VTTAESEAYLLDHLQHEHRGLFEWAAMPHERRARLHFVLPHAGTGHTHHPVIRLPGPCSGRRLRSVP
jgi:hypothetical protein